MEKKIPGGGLGKGRGEGGGEVGERLGEGGGGVGESRVRARVRVGVWTYPPKQPEWRHDEILDSVSCSALVASWAHMKILLGPQDSVRQDAVRPNQSSGKMAQ